MTDEEFINLINGANTVNAKPKFRGTGMPAKQSSDMIHSSNKEHYLQDVGKFGSDLAKWAKQQQANDLNKSKEQIIQDLKKEGRI